MSLSKKMNYTFDNQLYKEKALKKKKQLYLLNKNKQIRQLMQFCNENNLSY